MKCSHILPHFEQATYNGTMGQSWRTIPEQKREQEKERNNYGTIIGFFICCARVYWSSPVLYLMVSLCQSSSSQSLPTSLIIKTPSCFQGNLPKKIQMYNYTLLNLCNLNTSVLHSCPFGSRSSRDQHQIFYLFMLRKKEQKQ